MSSFGFTGTRNGMTEKQKEKVKELFLKNNVNESTIFRHGDCVGADEDSHNIAKSLNLSVIIHPPVDFSLRSFCKDAKIVLPPETHLKRNRNIVDNSSILIATPWNEEGELDRGGTWYTINYAKKKGLKIFIVRPSGIIEEIG